MKSPISNPMSFWVEQDVLEYAYHHQIPLASVYGEILEEKRTETKKGEQQKARNPRLFDLEKPIYSTTGCQRTGCVYCGFGCHRERSPNRWEIAEELSNPAIIDYMESWKTLFTAYGKAKVQLSHVLQTEFPTIP